MRRHLFDDRIVEAGQVTGFIDTSLRDFAAEGFGLWALRPAPPDADPRDPALRRAAPVGVVGLRRKGGPGRDPEVEIVYSLEPEHWGRGLATEAARAVLDHAFGVLGLPRVVAEVDRANTASVRVAENLGMRPYTDDSASRRAAGEEAGGSDALLRFVAERGGSP